MLDNLPNNRMYTLSDRTARCEFHDRIERCIKRLPNTDLGKEVYKSLQTILLKGNNYANEERQVYDSFIKLLHSAQDHLHESFKENRIDASHEYLKTKLL